MCGIAGVYAYHPSAAGYSEAALQAIHDAQRARGPDADGLWRSCDGRVGLAHRRLAIQDLSPAGAQPMITPDGRCQLVFNGEIYNAPELRAELVAQGLSFRGHSDTEVVLALLARDGVAALPRLRGMFAIAFRDAVSGILTLARDPFGIKPLYLADDGWRAWFASSVRALAGAVSRRLEPAAEAGFYLWGSVPEPLTPYLDIRQVPAGCYQQVTVTGSQPPVRYADWREHYHAAVPTEAAVTEALRESVQAHLLADVPVGLFLSAGLDSNLLLAALGEATQDTRAVTLRFEEYAGSADDESVLAARFAQAAGVPHDLVTLTRADFEAMLPDFWAAMDQPSVDGLNTWLVSWAAARAGLKVVLSGVGGDELFGGYPSFRDVPRWHRLLSLPSRLAGPLLRPALPGLSRLANEHLGWPRLPALLAQCHTLADAWRLKRGLFLAEELPALMGAERAAEGLARLRALSPWPGVEAASLSPEARVSIWEIERYQRNQLLRDSDWASMAHSLELRTPLVDMRLHAAVAGHFRAGLRGKLPWYAASLPDATRRLLAQRPKTGFTTPAGRWLQEVDGLQGWRRHDILAPARTPAARRWAVVVWQRHVGGSS